MNKRFKYLVEKYLDHSLSAPEKAEFAKFLDDRECADYLKKAEKAERIIQEGFRKLIEKADVSASARAEAEDDTPEEIREVVKRFGGKDDPVARAKVKLMHARMIRRNKIKRLINYASAAFFVVGLYFLWTDYLVPIPQSVFRAYYKQYEFAEISPATVPDERIRSAMSMYDKADFPGSAGLCRDIIASGTTEGNIHFLYGLNLMAMDSMLRAIEEFDAQINSTTLQSTDRQPPVHWYKGLCYLHLNKPIAALWEIGKPYYRKLKKLMRL